ncbi:hypothetical protein WH47_12228 [Habropoda laboriosa]|uniref:C2H2-type domain-containing protein n=1 Tax=Habropoda laboriosa TaxID=597456 RepID=A0A0L7RAN6_9HYME|nr:hypothetical protein WH47_12228 [Habropoda laboriosa]
MLIRCHFVVPEAASADVAGSKTSSEAVEIFHSEKFSPATTTSSPSNVDTKMVASTHNLDDLGVSHPASASSDRQQQQEKHGHTYRSAQTAQDKRSRLSNVINNLRKKVPDSRNGDSPRKEEDDRNSVERNLETLEKYVMTVLNGVIKDEEDDDREVGRKKEAEKGKEPEKLAADQEDEDSKGPAAKFEPSKPNESRTEAAVFPSERSDKPEIEESCLEHQNTLRNEESNCLELKESQESLSDIVCEERESSKVENSEEDEVCKGGKCSSKEAKSEELSVQDTGRNNSLEEEKKESRSLGTIIMERLSENQAEEKGNVDATKEDSRDYISENVELRNVCRDLLNDLLNGINQLIDENSQEKEEIRTLDISLEESKESRSQDFSMTSLHCSLPLDKVASVLQNCQSNELTVPQSPSSPSSSQGSKSPCKLPSPTVRHLCLYCDRKFMSISLRQRHTERVHQQGGGRRSERNSRKPSQNCQYCSDRCAESLEGLFQHMVGSHGDKYHGCLQCSTRYLTREALAGHMSENHSVSVERNLQFQEKMKEPSPCKELGNHSPREPSSPKERRSEEPDYEYRAESTLLKPMLLVKDTFNNPGSPEFDSSFYSSVSCNIRENLLHHLDGKLQSSSSNISSTSSCIVDNKPQQQPQQQSFYEHNVNQIQFPIDISLTAATPVYSKEYNNEEYENSSEYAQKPGKSSRSHPRRVSFEKYNFPRKYDGKEQWTCSIKDLSKFDISTQLSLRKKQQLLKERLGLCRLHHVHVPSETTDISQDEQKLGSRSPKEPENMDDVSTGVSKQEIDQKSRLDASKCMENKSDGSEGKSLQNTEFSIEFGSFLRLRKWDEKMSVEAAKKHEVVYAELTGEWSRPRVYICGACATKHVTLKEMEDHKVTSHPNVWCSHFEFSGDQRELYKHLFLPGKDIPTAKAKAAVLAEKVCTKCSKNCTTLPELHRHMLECGGDQAWLLGLFGNGKKKCKWRPFGSRSRRRRQRGMKRNIQNSQTPRVNTPKEKQPTGPRVRPSDRESIQKMLANLPPKRATRKVLQDSTLRTQGRLRNVQTRTRPRMVGDNSSASRLSRNKAALRNKLLKNAKSIQRNRCRIDNISAVIESVVRNYTPEDKKSDVVGERNELDKETKEKPTEGTSSIKDDALLDEKGNRAKVVRGPRVLGKKRNVKTKEGTVKSVDQVKKTGSLKVKAKAASKNSPEAKTDASSDATRSLKSSKISLKTVEKVSEADGLETSLASLNASIKAKSQLRTQDGKFAKNPNKDASPQKSPEIKSPVSGRPVAKGKGNEASPESSMTRSKLRAVSRFKNGEQLPKRNTRLSSDSDKMPTLEPAVQFSSNGEEYAETSANDLPILSPATPASNPEKLLRGKHLVSKTLNLDDKDNSKRGEESEETEGKSESRGNVQGEEKEQKQGKGRRAKGEVRNLDKSLECAAASKEVSKGVSKEKFKRKSAPGRIVNIEEKKTPAKGPEEVSLKKEMRQKKEEGRLETRSNAKAKLEKVLDDDSPMKIQNVPFEVKKLIGSDSKEDLLTKLVLTSRIATSKRCLRQPVSKLRPEQGKGKVKRDLELQKAKLDSESISDASTKKEKFDARRKSLRSTDKKDKVALKDDKMVLDEVSKIREAVNEVKTAIRGRRSSSLSSDSKSVINTNQTLLCDSQSKQEVEVIVQNIDKRQTRGSLLNFTEGEAQNEDNDMPLKKNSLGKRRGRIKSINDTLDKKNSEMYQVRSEEIDKNTSSESIDESKSDEKDSIQFEEGNLAKNRQEESDKNEKELAQASNPSENSETGKVNLNLNHLQVETSNSVDSGKENSLEIRAPVQKLKVGRPRKSWGAKKERASKRSLNNVIGILTEGMNIPVVTQQNVLSAQITSDSANSGEFLQNNNQEPCDGNSRSQSIEKNNKFSENSVPEVPSAFDTLIEEIPCIPEQIEEVSKKDLSMESPIMKNQKIESPSKDIKDQTPPANDIILDLSRRKQKGKGSFLEKIVSKIAKQKDALLEGEVGSLLDTAADELTSILDEVGTGFPESSENSVNKTRIEKKVEDSRQEIDQESIKENCQDILIPKLFDKSLGNNETKVETEEKKLPLQKEEPSKKNPDQKEVNSESINSSYQEVTDQQVEVKWPSEIEKNTSLEVQSDPKVHDKVVSVVSSLVPNGIRLPVSENIPQPSLNGSTEVCLPKEQDKAVKKNEDIVIKDTKVKRKSKKRSLEGNSPKKSKRKSMELAENSEELHVIEKSKQVPSTKENVDDDSSSEVSGKKVQCGKRKSITDEPETKYSEENKIVEDVQIIEDPNESAKKLKVHSAEDKVAEINENSIEDPASVMKNKDEEEKFSSLLRITGKRKSYVEVMDQYPEVEFSARRSSKRRSLQEEKTNQFIEEDTVSKVECVEVKESSVVEEISEDIRGLNRRSSRMKSMIQAKDVENDPVISISNITPVEDPELPVEDSLEKKESSKLEMQVIKPDTAISNQLPPRRSLRTSKFNEETEDQSKNFVDLTNVQIASPSLEPFKVPEVTEVLQHTKKRTYKKRSTTDDHSDTQNNCTVTTEPEVSNAECPEVSKSLVEKEEQSENSSLKVPSESYKRSSRSSNREQLDLERSSSSGSIDLTQSNRIRSSKRKQLSSEDLLGQESPNQRAESVDNLSETSCVSESSYFRKKRFSKRKKEFQEPPEDVQTDTSITDSESMDTEKSTDRRQSLKRRAKKNISFFEEFDLVDDFDIPMDIQDLILKEEDEEDGEQKDEEDEEQKDEEDEEQKDEEDEEQKDEEKVDSNVDSISQAQDEFQTPKKRTAGNYVVVHRKTGEILIVEKRKKLTKEAAKFFCDVCTTSFTRKSSLKKHNQSQSHLLQIAKFRKEKTCTEDNKNIEDTCNTNHNDISNDENKSVTDEVMNLSLESKNNQKETDMSEPIINQKDLESVQNDSCYINPLEQESLMDSQTTEQHIFEDELLDEEICKITENMSHDEYVLTDHVSPEPESTSTPIKIEIKKVEAEVKRRKHETKKDKTKKKSLTDEEVVLDSPELETPSDSTLITVLGANMSIKITKSSHLNMLQPNFDNKDVLEDSEGCCSFEDSSIVTNVKPRTDISPVKESEFKEKCSEYLPRLQECQGVDMEVEDTILRTEVNKIVDSNKGYQLDPDEKTENCFRANLEDRDNKERQPHEHLSLKFTINKRSIEQCKEIDSESKKSFELNYSNNMKFVQVDPLKQINHSEPETDPIEEDLNLSSSKTLRKGSRRNLENLEELNISKVQNLEEDTMNLDNSGDQETPAIVEEKIEIEKQSEPLKTSRHGKSKKNKAKKHLEEAENNSEDKIGKKSPRSKGNQNKLVFDEVTKLPEIISDQETFYKKEESNCLVPNSQLEINFDKTTSPMQTENKLEHESKGLEIVEEQETEKLYPEPEVSEGISLIKSVEVQQIHDKNKIKPFQSMDDDEISLSSSLADKPLSQLLLDREEKIESSTIFLKDCDNEHKSQDKSETDDINSKTNEYKIDENSMDTNELTDNQKSDDKELTSNDQSKLQIVSEEEFEQETELKSAENSEKESKISSESENSEAVPLIKSVSNEKQSYNTVETKTISNSRKSSTSDHQSLCKKVSRAHKYSNKDNYKKSRNKKVSLRNKISELTSESDDTESEDKIESQNKSKIVKSVFGRVFGGEKTDKVKEVLNDWVSKSEDDSETSRTEFESSSPSEVKIKGPSGLKNENKDTKRHSVLSSMPFSPKKRSAKRSKKSSSSDRAKEKSSVPENQEEQRSGKHIKSKNSSNNKKKHEPDTSNGYFLVLPPRKCRPSKKRAEELISRTFENDFLESNVDKSQKSSKHKEGNYGLRNQGKPDLTIKDSGYGSFNYDEDSTKVVILPLEDLTEDDQKIVKRRKSSSSRKSKSKTDDEDWRDLVIDKRNLKNSKESGDEENCFIKELPQRESLTSRLSVNLESSQSCSSLAPSSVRNRSPSMDRNSQTTRDSDVDEEDEDLGHRRISPLFICGTPRSSIESSSNSENEKEDENVTVNEAVTRKRSSSEFSGEKIVIRSPSSTHKGEVVTITPTDAIEDNALDVPQEIETTKPRQGKVLNFDEELFVECCSRLKATTENELRGAKKIKLDHNEAYHRKDDQQQGFRGPRDRWRDVESQNSLGSLLESVNQLLGEEMYSAREGDYPKRGSRNLRSEHSSRSASPDMSRADNLGYEDSLDVAFEHNNKLRDKIQQRMRESENLIASTFSQKNSIEIVDGEQLSKNNEHNMLRNTYSHLQEQRRHLSGTNLLNGGYNDTSHVRSLPEQQGTGKMNLDSSGALKSKMNSSLGGLLDKALSNLLHNNEKHDHNGSTPMKVLAELACARAPTSTTEEQASQEVVQAVGTISPGKDSVSDASPIDMPKDLQKKTRNPIKELFERKKEINERKQQEKSKTEAALRELNVHRQRKAKKTKKHQDFPLIRRGEHGGLVERKKRRDGFERKEEFVSDRIKDVYEFDEEESQMEPNLGSVMSYRSRPGYEVSCLKTKEVDVAGLMSKAIGDSLENGKTGDALSSRLESMIDRKFKELEKFAPKTKGALKAFQSEDQQRQVTGPMDEFVERKQPKGKKTVEPSLKHSKLKKRSKNPKKKTRNAWYENDSSDEYRTAVKTEDVGVGISKSQRTCSKGKQNIFAELYTSSESEFEDEDVDFESRRQRRVKKTTKKATEFQNVDQSQELVNKYSSENEDHVDDWRSEDLKDNAAKHDSDNKKSESEMSDHPLVIDERKDVDEQRNSDEEIENQYERNFEMDDLYREDSSVVDSDAEEPINTVQPNVPEESGAKSPCLPQEKIDNKTDYMQENELIPLEEALDLLDQADNETSLETKYGNVNVNIKPVENIDTVVSTELEKEMFTHVQEPTAKSPTTEEEQEEEPDNDLLVLPEKLSSNEKPQKESENLPLHVFLSRKVQESKKRKEQQLKKMQEEQERILMDFQPTRRQRKCAIGKQGLLAEISSSDEETNPRDRRTNDRSDHDKPRKQKRESKEKRKERYIEKKHEQMIAKEQKAIEEEILREVGKKKESLAQNIADVTADVNGTKEPEKTESIDRKVIQEPVQKKKHQVKDKQKKQNKTDENTYAKNNREGLSDLENNCNKSVSIETNHESESKQESSTKQKKHSKSPIKPKKTSKTDIKVTTIGKKNKNSNTEKKSKADSKGSKDKERRSSSGKRDSDDEELKTTKSWNKVEEGVGVAIGRRKRAAANQLYYWSSSSDEEEILEVVPVVEEEEDDRQEQHGWIVGDSHKRMITMLAMEKQLKEKRRRSEDEFEPGKAKSKKHRNSTS